MTPSEHRLIIEMFKRQELAYAALVETLKGQGIVQKGDLAAHDALLSESGQIRKQLEDNVEETYLNFATALEVKTGLSDED